MTATNLSSDVQQALNQVAQAQAEGKITASAVENLKCWLVENRYATYRPAIVQHIREGKWQKLDDVFWTVIPFGTGGRRGRMYEFGSNAINDRTIGESAQGLADYLRSTNSAAKELRCAIAYDTRHNSRRFAELCASVMVANGFRVFFLDDYRATPQLSYAVRAKNCDCGIMVTASHNPPSDNAVKVYQSTGGQVLPPHDKAIIDRVMNVEEIKQVPFAEALKAGKVEICTAEIDRDYLAEAVKYAFAGPREVNILYSPLHGVGGFAVPPLLAAAGFKNVAIFGPHAEPSGDFPNVPGHVSNPENTVVFDSMIDLAKKSQAEPGVTSVGAIDLILATDPDCDRMGAAAKLRPESTSPWATINGNQLGALLTDYVLGVRQASGQLKPNSYIIKTLVTTEMIRRICESYGVRCEGNIHVGFKWIGGLMDQLGPGDFEFGTEESHGFLIGSYARDKDGAVACLLMALMAAQLKAQGKTIHQRLDELLQKHGYHEESVLNVQMEGSEGMAAMKRLMQSFRTSPPKSLGGLDVVAVRDYEALTTRKADGSVEKLDAPAANMVILDLSKPGNYVAVRPSGTEPKVKYYIFASADAEQSRDLVAAKKMIGERIKQMRDELKS
jgi:phosphoglucomutase/phosphomannomutase